MELGDRTARKQRKRSRGSLFEPGPGTAVMLRLRPRLLFRRLLAALGGGPDDGVVVAVPDSFDRNPVAVLRADGDQVIEPCVVQEVLVLVQPDTQSVRSECREHVP